MTRKKSICLKWTLILCLSVLSQFVNSRPQDMSLAPVSNSTNSVQTTENPTRYRYKNNEQSLALFKLPLVISFVNNSILNPFNIISKKETNNTLDPSKTNLDKTHFYFINSLQNKSERTSRLISKNKTNDSRKKLGNISIRNKSTTENVRIVNYKNKIKVSEPEYGDTISSPQKNKPLIRKVVTKWRDKAKYEDLDFSLETTTSNEHVQYLEHLIHKDISTEAAEKYYNQNQNQKLNNLYNKLVNNRYKPKPEYSAETQVYSSNVHIIDRYPFPSSRPTYVFTTPMPTPIITNVGNPRPWQQASFQNVYRKTTKKPAQRKKPLKNQYGYHNSVYNNQYPQHNFDVTTFQPSTAYTDRIVIRPEEYSASPDDCPTIFLTLNNTFQGQGKEACPDLNIAVNTNVINKNVVIESDEEETESLFPGAFDVPIDDSEAESTEANDYFESEENEEQEESASVEGTGFTNYNAANEEILANSPEAGGFGSPSTELASLHKPGRPGGNDDDLFSYSGFIDFFRPSLSALSWLVSLSPFNFGLLSFFFSPIAMIFAGAYGIATFFSRLPFAREAPKVVHVYQPQWQWDDDIKTWHLNSFPNDREWNSRIPKNSKEDTKTGQSTWLSKFKEWMKSKTIELKERSQKQAILDDWKNKRKKREAWTRITSQKTPEVEKKVELASNTSSRDVKNKGSGIGDSIKMVASQLLENPSNSSVQVPIVADTRIPPKLKNQLVQKHKIKTRNENGEEPLENVHVGIAVPVTMEELESDNKVSEISNESSTSNEGISTWILLSNPMSKDNITTSTEPTKVEETLKKQKPVPSKNKTKRPQVNKTQVAKRPFFGSTNKSDLVAGGSAINENVYNKIKDTVMSNVQKNKPTPTQRPTTPSTTTVASKTEPTTTKKEVVTKLTSALPVVAVTSKPTKKRNKNKPKLSSTTEAAVSNESALLPMEPKEQEIELEISTPASTTKKPKRSSTKKKKTKKRKTSKPEPESGTSVSAIKTSNKTKSSKPSKKPTDVTGVTTQIYNYFSREVMPSVGVGVIGLASLVGLASYFLYPFATPVRRTLEVDKKDDLYKHNAEEYASDGNGQPEEEMLGTVLAGMPAHSKHKLNPYAGQTTHMNRNPYPVKKDQDLRYRHVSTSSYEPNYNVRYPQQKTGIAHGAVYSEPVNYNSQVPQQQQYETRHVYTTESKYTYDKGQTSYTPSYPAVEPIYAAPQTGPSGLLSYGSDSSNSVVYGVKPSADSDFKPVYPFEGQYYGEHQTTNNPLTYPPTSMYLGSNDDSEQQEENKYEESSYEDQNNADNKFVVGNIPKELSDTATPAVVPEHGPRNLRRKRSITFQKRSITGSIEDILKQAKETNKDVFLSNEIDEALGNTFKNVPVATEPTLVSNENKTSEIKEVFTVYAAPVNSTDETKTTTDTPVTSETSDFVESVSTQPINGNKQEVVTGTEVSNELDITTKAFRVYEVFSSNSPAEVTEQANKNDFKTETTTLKNMMTETTTEFKSETTSNIPPTSYVSDTKAPIASTSRPRPTMYPEVITYPPLNQEGSIFTFLKRLIEFKYRLGLSLIQNTSESLNRYLRSMESTVQKVAKASKAQD